VVNYSLIQMNCPERLPRAASLYLHVPFCAGACDYCDFYSVPAGAADPRLDSLAAALLRQSGALLRSFVVEQVPTVYLGGGTPSLLGPRRLRRLLGGLQRLLPAPAAEITLEANPESVTPELLAACREGGVTRLSLGVQSFHRPSRQAVHRVGGSSFEEEMEKKLTLARDLFGEGWCADLITGLPFQTEAVLMEDIARLLAFRPGHVSLYALTLEEGTPLAKRPHPALPGEDEADRLWIAGRDALLQAGYGQYEVSAFALPGRECRHNRRYWRLESWLGAGPAASGTMVDEAAGTALRLAFPPDVDAFLAAVEAASPAYLPRTPADAGPFAQPLDRDTLIRETLLMGFRTREGPDRAAFRRRFGLSLEELLPRTFSRWRDRGLLGADAKSLTPEGLLFLNAFLREAFQELESRESPARQGTPFSYNSSQNRSMSAFQLTP